MFSTLSTQSIIFGYSNTTSINEKKIFLDVRTIRSIKTLLLYYVNTLGKETSINHQLGKDPASSSPTRTKMLHYNL